MERFSVVGQRVPRVDGPSLVTGNAIYTADVVLPRMLCGKILRSSHPHARVLHVDVERARRLPGVKAVITGKDTAGKTFGIVPDEPAMAVDKVRYVGEAMAAVAAVDEDVAEEALRLIRVEYEPLPAVFDALESMQQGAPLIHEHLQSNVSFNPQFHFGDVERGFAESDYIREDTFTTGSQCHCALEPHGAVADFDVASGKLTLWSSTQGPFFLSTDLALTLGIPLRNVSVIKPRVGGGFGGKRELSACDFSAALLSRLAGQPVKIIYTREEEFIATRARHPMILRIKTGIKKDGTLVAREGSVIADGGAYTGRGNIIVQQAGTEMAGPFRCPNVKYTGYHVYTNNPVSSSFRGFGTLQARYAIESQLDLLAHDLGLDPADIRLKNAVRPGETTSIGWQISSCGLTECIEKVVEASGWRERHGKLPPNHGLGIACNDYVSGSGSFGYADSSAAYVRLHDDGTVVLFTGAADIGQGSDTALSQIAAEELGLPLDHVRLVTADTEMAPRDLGTCASRVTFVAGNAVKAAAVDARKQLFEIVADRLEANPDDLDARNGRIYVQGSPDRGLSYADAAVYVMKERGVHIQGCGSFTSKVDRSRSKLNTAPTYSFGAQVAEVEVDVHTGEIKLHRFNAAYDCGYAINPMSLEGQVEGAITCGVGHTVLEERIMEDGRMLNASLLSYRVPTALESLSIETMLVETVDPAGPFGAKGVSEGAQVPVAPAIANAIYDAIGIRLTDMPITPARVLSALEQKRISQEKAEGRSRWQRDVAEKDADQGKNPPVEQRGTG